MGFMEPGAFNPATLSGLKAEPGSLGIAAAMNQTTMPPPSFLHSLAAPWSLAGSTHFHTTLGSADASAQAVGNGEARGERKADGEAKEELASPATERSSERSGAVEKSGKRGKRGDDERSGRDEAEDGDGEDAKSEGEAELVASLEHLTDPVEIKKVKRWVGGDACHAQVCLCVNACV